MSYLAVASAQPQLAFGMGRHFGNAPERNRARRRLRAAFTTAWASVEAPAPGAYLITADRAVLTAGYDRLVTAVRACLAQVAERSATTGASAGLTASTPLSTATTAGPVTAGPPAAPGSREA